MAVAVQKKSSVRNMKLSKEMVKKRAQIVNDEMDLLISRLMNAAHDSEGKLEAMKDIKELRELCHRARRRFMSEKALLRIKPNIVILGDLHGQFLDLQKMLSILGLPPKRRFLFLGDYVDRGHNSMETICLLLALKVRFPSRLYLLRGNHEARATNMVYGFIEECRSRFGKKEGSQVWTEFQHVFNCMPISAIVGDRMFCTHGGISEDLLNWKQFDRISRPTDVTDYGLVTDLLWADPCATIENYAASPRGVSQVFGIKAVEEFCARMEIDVIVRGHQAAENGYEVLFDKRCITIFSAPHYTDMVNKAACMYVSKKLKCSIYTYTKEDKLPKLKEKLQIGSSKK